MMLAIVVNGSSITIFFLSLLEFLFIIPSVIKSRRNKAPFLAFLKGAIYKHGQGKKGVLLVIASVGIAIGMLVIGPLLISVQEILISAAFGEPALQQARENLNQFVIVQPGLVDVMLYSVTSFLIIALNEELFFREFLQRVIGRSRGTNAMLSAAIFTVYHLVTTMNLFSIVYLGTYYFVWGLVLSFEYYASNEQLLFPIMTHGLFNLLLLIL
jgi:membrane protease YdiL (CAAX protease family)